MPGLPFRSALRSFRKNPFLTFIALLSLSLGIGANTAIFSLIDQLLLRMLPVKDPRELVQLAARGSHYGSNWGMNAMSYPMYKDFRDRNQVFSGVICRFGTPLSLGFDGRTERIQGELVSGNYFKLLGITAARGRAITPEDDRKPGAHPVAVLAYGFWQSRFGGDLSIVGKPIYLNSTPMTVIGIARRGFEGVEVGDATQVFVPMMMQKAMIPSMSRFYNLDDRRGRWVNVFARLKPGVTLEQAKAGIAPLYKQIIGMEVNEAAFSKATDYTRKQFLASRMEVMEGATGRSMLRRQFSTPLYVLMALTAVVLLIACANVANLLIARAAARRKEIAIRLALGASRAQIIRQLLTESLLLSLAAGASGLAIGVWLVQVLLRFFNSEAAQLTITGRIDPRTLAFTMGLSLLTAVLFGLAPALQAARPEVAGTLKDEAGGVTGGGASARFRKGLVVAQVSLSVLLLIAGGLFVRSLVNLRNLDPGFRVDHLVSFAIDPPLNGYNDERTRAFERQLLDAIEALPGVQSAGYGVMRVLDGDEWDSSVTVEGYQAKQGEDMNPYFNAVSPGYFATLGIPLVAGRDFSLQDERNNHQVCVVNETFAKKYFPAGAAVGRHLGQGNDPGTKTDIEIVGVIKDAKYQSMRELIQRQVFLPLNQMPLTTAVVGYVRTNTDPVRFFTTLRAVVRNLDPNMPVSSMRTLEDQVNRSLITERFVAGLSAAFGALATTLAVIGLYGVMAFTVSRRSREIGIRMALGAESASVLTMVMKEVALLVGIGVAIALPLYFAAARLVQSQLYGVSHNDAGTVAGAVLLLAATAMLAGYLPARRAAAIDPIRVLRYE